MYGNKTVFLQESLVFRALMKSYRTAKMTNREKQVHFVLNIAYFACSCGFFCFGLVLFFHHWTRYLNIIVYFQIPQVVKIIKSNLNSITL